MSVSSSNTTRNVTKLRIVFLGDQGVGKSSIIDRYTTNRFEEAHYATVGIDFNLKDIILNGQGYRLQMWDTAGQERYRSLIPTYMKNAQCVVFVFDVGKASTLENLREWHKIFVENQLAPGFIVANKLDLPTRKVSQEDAQKLSAELGLKYIEVSAKLGRNIDFLFKSIVAQIVAHDNQEQAIQTSRNRLQQKGKQQVTTIKSIVLKQDRAWFHRFKCCGET